MFEDQRSYNDYARSELGDVTSSIIGYYNMETNRVNMYDLTRVESYSDSRRRSNSAALVNKVLSQPRAERTVATIVHEATHQLAYNSGLQTRYADNPFWVSEGIAIYFETPDLRSSKGWRTVGGINPVNMNRFFKYLNYRPANSLQTLLQDDKRFRDSSLVGDAYGEAWALNYFLLRTRREQYVRYLKVVAAQPPLNKPDPERRLRQFRAFFGDLEELDKEFLRYFIRMRR